MKFNDFINKNKSTLDEGLSTGHGKVEMAIRSLGYDYKTESDDHGKVFVLDNDYEVESWNNGKIVLKKNGKILSKLQEFDFKKILGAVTEMLKKHVKEPEKEPEKESA